ncbi:MAG TPA: hypothetical protein PLL78_10455 [Fimbriimonadaceae bacterium]|nr:hypothetical protein [Fimbriimonadaceae bacterium]HRJ97096.1 hypothetical protein [Fimbriimonadaceae bacterium]
MESRPVFLGIAGGSGSGKTHLAQRVRELAGPQVAALISMDQYFRTSSEVDTADLNFDHPNHLDLELLTHHLAELSEGRGVRTPAYDFAKREQKPDVIEIQPVPVVIVEGLFVLSAPVLSFLDMTCFLDVADDQRLLGRILRDLKERQDRIENIIARYQRFVRPSYHVFVAPSRQNADVVVDFTYRRALFTRLLAHIVTDYARGYVDLVALLADLKSENYTLGYRADESIMPIGIDIRRLAKAYPEHAFPEASQDDQVEPRLHLSRGRQEERT